MGRLPTYLPTYLSLLKSILLIISRSSICAMNLTRVIIVVNQNSADVTHEIARIGLFSVLEVNVGMICAALPTCGPLFFKDSGRSSGGIFGGDGSGSSSGKMNSFMRRKVAAGLGGGRSGSSLGKEPRVGVFTGETGLSTVDESRYEGEDEDEDEDPQRGAEGGQDAVPLRDVGVGAKAVAGHSELGLVRQSERTASNMGNGNEIHIRTDIYVA